MSRGWWKVCSTWQSGHANSLTSTISTILRDDDEVKRSLVQRESHDEEWYCQQRQKQSRDRLEMQKDMTVSQREEVKLMQRHVHVMRVQTQVTKDVEMEVECSLCCKVIATDQWRVLHVARSYHVDCYLCCVCNEQPVDLIGWEFESRVYCRSHFIELFKPRCYSCDEIIIQSECTEAEGHAFHLHCFTCKECGRQLGGNQYIISTTRDAYCVNCFDCKFSDFCEECGEVIRGACIRHDQRTWHADVACFKCNACIKSLLGACFLPANDGRIYCSTVCAETWQKQKEEQLRQKEQLQVASEVADKEKVIPKTKSVSFNDQNLLQVKAIVDDQCSICSSTSSSSSSSSSDWLDVASSPRHVTSLKFQTNQSTCTVS